MQDTIKSDPGSERRVLESTITTKQAKRAMGVPESRKKLFLRSLSGDCSPRSAIKAFCQSCVGYEDLPRAVKECTADACPLFAYRPYRK